MAQSRAESPPPEINKRFSKKASGGYRLLKDPKDIYFSDLIRQVDGPIAMLPCVSLNYYASCEECDEENCQIKSVFEEVRDNTLKILTKTSIDMMRHHV